MAGAALSVHAVLTSPWTGSLAGPPRLRREASSGPPPAPKKHRVQLTHAQETRRVLAARAAHAHQANRLLPRFRRSQDRDAGLDPDLGLGIWPGERPVELPDRGPGFDSTTYPAAALEPEQPAGVHLQAVKAFEILGRSFLRRRMVYLASELGEGLEDFVVGEGAGPLVECLKSEVEPMWQGHQAFGVEPYRPVARVDALAVFRHAERDPHEAPLIDHCPEQPAHDARLFGLTRIPRKRYHGHSS